MTIKNTNQNSAVSIDKLGQKLKTVEVKFSDQPVITAKDVANLKDMLGVDHTHVPLIAVYCGAKMGNNSIYQEVSYDLGKALADNDLGLVYGGASIGLMGSVADGTVDADGVAIGVLPTFMLDYEVAHEKLTQLHLTDSMHTRKAIMEEYAKGFIALPGGVGTLDEIMEIATWRQLELHQNPMILLNVNGYYDRLVEHLKHSVTEGFLREEDLKRFYVCDNVASAITILKSYN